MLSIWCLVYQLVISMTPKFNRFLPNSVGCLEVVAIESPVVYYIFKQKSRNKWLFEI